MRIAILAVLVLIEPTIALAQMCKWVDEAGSVHYAERCPEQAQTEIIELERGPSQANVEAAENAYQRNTADSTAAEQPEASAPVDFVRRESSNTIAWSDIHCPSGNRTSYVRKMDKACDRARETYIAPLREAEIERCVEQEQRDRKECEQRYADYLNPNYVGRLDEPRQFDFVPECKIARKCRAEAGLPDNTRRYPVWDYYRGN